MQSLVRVIMKNFKFQIFQTLDIRFCTGMMVALTIMYHHATVAGEGEHGPCHSNHSGLPKFP
jgi:hypothetical protein